MDVPTLVVGTQRYRFDVDVEDMKRSIVDAVRNGGSFVTIIGTSGRRTDLLITASTDARIEFAPPPEPEVAGAGGPEALRDDYDLDYGALRALCTGSLAKLSRKIPRACAATAGRSSSSVRDSRKASIETESITSPPVTRHGSVPPPDRARASRR